MQVDWRFFQQDGQWFARETNTMPQWAGSCWYYLRFMDPANAEAAWGVKAEQDWMPVDLCARLRYPRRLKCCNILSH